MSNHSYLVSFCRFGVGPFHVQIKFVLDYYLKEKKTYSDEHIGTFEIELAPLKEMPHSVHLFLEQISHGLWSNRQGLAFHINTNHILLGGPTTKEARKVFQQYNLDHLAFPEYSESFPHDEYTLGFSGRPGGPSFYINTANNSHVHGPGGQTQHALSEFADACFAKVVSGFDALHDIIEETDANHQTLIIDMKIIEWDGRYREKDDAEWYDATESVVKPPEDDYSDDVYYGESSGASYADDDKGYAARVGEEKHDALDAKENGHKIHRHHHGENFQQQREEEELLAAGPPRLVEPPPDMLVHLTELQRDKAEA
jgi:cyclophilin family peptidyl-prolyl cis-trans isomerase